MYSLRSVNVMSCAKITGAIHGGLGLIFLPFFLLGGFISLFSGNNSGDLPGAVMLILAFLAPLFYGAMGFALGAFMGWAYNLVARHLGGIQLELKPMSSNSQSNLGLI